MWDSLKLKGVVVSLLLHLLMWYILDPLGLVTPYFAFCSLITLTYVLYYIFLTHPLLYLTYMVDTVLGSKLHQNVITNFSNLCLICLYCLYWIWIRNCINSADFTVRRGWFPSLAFFFWGYDAAVARSWTLLLNPSDPCSFLPRAASSFFLHVASLKARRCSTTMGFTKYALFLLIFWYIHLLNKDIHLLYTWHVVLESWQSAAYLFQKWFQKDTQLEIIICMSVLP